MKEVVLNALRTRASSGPPKKLFETTWEWQQLIETAPAAQSLVADSEDYTIVFTQDGVYKANAGCNMLSDAYQIDGSKLTLLPGPTTLAECSQDSSSDLYVSLLGKVDGYKLQNGRLILTFGDGAGQMGFANAGAAE